MIEEIKSIKSDKSEIRKFGILFGIIFFAIAGFLFWKDNAFFQMMMIIGAVFLATGVVLPVVLTPIYLVWMVFAAILGWIMTRVILSLLYFFVFTPIGIFSRIFGKQFLDITSASTTDSYWNYRSVDDNQETTYEKQF